MKKKLLFVCECNLNRSPTFEKYFKKKLSDKYEVKSAGTLFGYPNRLDKKLIDWADVIYIMDMEQWVHLHARYQEAFVPRNKVKIIGISDQYDTDDSKLIRLIDLWVRHLMDE